MDDGCTAAGRRLRCARLQLRRAGLACGVFLPIQQTGSLFSFVKEERMNVTNLVIRRIPGARAEQGGGGLARNKGGAHSQHEIC